MSQSVLLVAIFLFLLLAGMCGLAAISVFVSLGKFLGGFLQGFMERYEQ